MTACCFLFLPALVIYFFNFFWKVLISGCRGLYLHLIYLLFCTEILRVSGMTPNQGFGERDTLRHRSPSPMASSNFISNVSGTGLGGWNSLPREVVWYSQLYYGLNLCLFWFLPRTCFSCYEVHRTLSSQYAATSCGYISPMLTLSPAQAKH